MKKILDLILLVIVAILIFSLFWKDEQKTLNNTLDISFETKNLTVPASVSVLVKNYTG